MIFKHYLPAVFIAIAVFTGCTKDTVVPAGSDKSPLTGFTEYIIPAGKQFSNGTVANAINTADYRFQAYFDSTAIYTLPAGDQQDINKLTGFADNGTTHLEYSARFGWRWSEGRLRLFGYVHNNGIIQEKQIGAIDIGKVYTCSIKVSGKSYLFAVDGLGTVTLPREAATVTGQGYRLFPYFGGNNVAPHEIHVWLKYL